MLLLTIPHRPEQREAACVICAVCFSVGISALEQAGLKECVCMLLCFGCVCVCFRITGGVKKVVFALVCKSEIKHTPTKQGEGLCLGTHQPCQPLDAHTYGLIL